MRNGLMTMAIATALAAISVAALAHGGQGAGAGMAGGDCPMMGGGAGMQGMGPMAGAGGPGGQAGPGGMHGMRGERMPEIAAQRLATVRDALKLQPGQTAAWDAFEAKARGNIDARLKMREGMVERRGNADAMAEYRVTMMKFNAQAAEEMLAARKALVAVLTPEQKATFDKFGPGMGPMARGPAGERRGPGMHRGSGPATPGGGPSSSVYSGA